MVVVVIVIPAVVFPLYHLNATFDSMYVVLPEHESTTLDSGRLPHGQSENVWMLCNITFQSFTTVTQNLSCVVLPPLACTTISHAEEKDKAQKIELIEDITSLGAGTIYTRRPLHFSGLDSAKTFSSLLEAGAVHGC